MPKIPIHALAAARPQRQSSLDARTVWVDYHDGMLELHSPYDEHLIAMLKAAIPYTMRAWSKRRKCWQVDPSQADVLHDVVYRALGIDVSIPPATIGKTATVETRLLNVRYIGRVKERADGSESAFGWADNSWSVIIPGDVLRAWFGQATADRPAEHNTLYAVLGIARTVDAADVKSAYRRMARQWHPDVCSEPDAGEQFLKIQRAYEVLGDVRKRARYDAGLALETSLKDRPSRSVAEEYAPQLRCGMILASGIERLGRFVVADVLSWLDIEDDQGRILVTSWPAGADTFVEAWVQP